MSIRFDDDPDIAIGITMPMVNSRTGFFEQSYTTLEASKSNLRNLLLTMKGERPMQPDFGTDLMKMIFEPDDGSLIDRIENTIKEAVDFWLPYLKLNNIEVHNVTAEADDDNMSRYNVKIVFSIINIPREFDSITFTLDATNI